MKKVTVDFACKIEGFMNPLQRLNQSGFSREPGETETELQTQKQVRIYWRLGSRPVEAGSVMTGHRGVQRPKDGVIYTPPENPATQRFHH